MGMADVVYRKIEIRERELLLAPLTRSNKREWLDLRARNRDWLSRWEATRPYLPAEIGGNEPIPNFRQMISYNFQEGKASRNFALGIWLLGAHPNCGARDRELIGQITLGGVVFGALRGAHIGYWIDQNHANYGYMTRAVNLLTNFAFNQLGLHRIEINCRPENIPSQAVATKAGYLLEGQRLRFLHIDGDWRDHLVFTKENPKIR
jgi:ribosomal-protein-alanine N-acetyltransferase